MISDNYFDTTAFETEREQVFERSQNTESFLAGHQDGYCLAKPEAYQLFSADTCVQTLCRQGYHAGVEEKFNLITDL